LPSTEYSFSDSLCSCVLASHGHSYRAIDPVPLLLQESGHRGAAQGWLPVPSAVPFWRGGDVCGRKKNRREPVRPTLGKIAGSQAYFGCLGSKPREGSPYLAGFKWTFASLPNPTQGENRWGLLLFAPGVALPHRGIIKIQKHTQKLQN
jgi:hypothetical protein